MQLKRLGTIGWWWYRELGAMADQPQMCLSCSVNPATTSDGTVPLCASCKALVKNPRGVEYQDKPKPKQAAESP